MDEIKIYPLDRVFEFIFIILPLADADRPSSRAASSASLGSRHFPKSTHFIEIYFDLILDVFFSVFFFFACGFNANNLNRLWNFFSPFFFFGLSVMACDLHEPGPGPGPARAFKFPKWWQSYGGIVCRWMELELVLGWLGYPANDSIVLDVLMWALIVLFECHYVCRHFGAPDPQTRPQDFCSSPQVATESGYDVMPQKQQQQHSSTFLCSLL